MPTAWKGPGVGRADGRVPRREKPEERLQHACRQRAAWARGLQAWHVAQPRATMQSAGLPDDFYTGWVRPIACEYKIRPRKQTAAQRAFQAAWEASGGVYWLIYSVAEFDAALATLGVLARLATREPGAAGGPPRAAGAE